MIGNYTIFTLNPDDIVVEQQRTSKFTFEELKKIVGGRVQIIPTGDGHAYVFCEDGIPRGLKTNPFVPDFVGRVLYTELKLIR
jgi:hypothetical protein